MVEFLGYRPSEIAAAAIMCAGKGIGDVSGVACGDSSRPFNERVNEVIKQSIFLSGSVDP